MKATRIALIVCLAAVAALIILTPTVEASRDLSWEDNDNGCGNNCNCPNQNSCNNHAGCHWSPCNHKCMSYPDHCNQGHGNGCGNGCNCPNKESCNNQDGCYWDNHECRKHR